jgi:hypothetical protein
MSDKIQSEQSRSTLATGSEFLTHYAPHCDPAWLAIYVPDAKRVLEGYEDANFTDIGALMVDYCNVLERAGVLHYGKTMEEAVKLATPNISDVGCAGSAATPQDNQPK